MHTRNYILTYRDEREQGAQSSRCIYSCVNICIRKYIRRYTHKYIVTYRDERQQGAQSCRCPFRCVHIWIWMCTHINTEIHIDVPRRATARCAVQHSTHTPCNTLQHTATHCNTLQRTPRRATARCAVQHTTIFLRRYIYTCVCVYTYTQKYILMYRDERAQGAQSSIPTSSWDLHALHRGKATVHYLLTPNQDRYSQKSARYSM